MEEEQKERVIEMCDQLTDLFGDGLFSALEDILGDDLDAMESTLQDYL